MIQRRSLSNSIRFEVFKRDKFTCQYCGKMAPDVVLNADHITPVSKGGTDDLMNLVTSCFECNSGKSDVELSDESAVSKSRIQAEMMEERRQQVQMMAKWQIELASMSVEIMAIEEAFQTIAGKSLTDAGRKEMRVHIRKHGIQEVIKAIAIAYDSYDEQTAFGKIGGILHVAKLERENPEEARFNKAFYRLRGILCAESAARYYTKDLMRECLHFGLTPERIVEWTASTRDIGSWYHLNNALERFIAQEKEKPSESSEDRL